MFSLYILDFTAPYAMPFITRTQHLSQSGPHASNQPGQFSMNQLKSNKQDITCIRYGSKITFRGSLGRYITAVPRNQILGKSIIVTSYISTD